MYLIKETIKSKKIQPNKCDVKIIENEKEKDVSIVLNYDWKQYWTKFHYWKIWYDKYIMTTKLKKLRFIKKNIQYKDE